MSGRNEQRKLGTTRGSPRRSRTAKASRISRRAVKSRCAREWVGWGRLSDDGPGHYNPDLSEGPWGGGSTASKAVHDRIHGPTLCGITVAITKCTKGGCKPDVGRRMPGAGLSCQSSGKAPLESQPSSRTGENPPYGMIGGIEETSASFEARSAPRSYPTIKASIAWRTSVGGGGGGQAPQPEGARAARGLDARIRLQHTSMPVRDASLKTAQVNQKSH